MNNVVKIIIAILFFIVIVSAFSLMTETNDVEDRDTIRLESPVFEYDSGMKYFKDEYISACAENEPEMIPYCECSYKYLLSELGEEGLLRNAMEFSLGIMTPDMQDAMIVALSNCMILLE
jgi:hypothetical protein